MEPTPKQLPDNKGNPMKEKEDMWLAQDRATDRKIVKTIKKNK